MPNFPTFYINIWSQEIKIRLKTRNLLITEPLQRTGTRVMIKNIFNKKNPKFFSENDKKTKGHDKIPNFIL